MGIPIRIRKRRQERDSASEEEDNDSNRYSEWPGEISDDENPTSWEEQWGSSQQGAYTQANLQINMVNQVPILEKLTKTTVNNFFDAIAQTETQQMRRLPIAVRNSQISGECKREMDWATRRKPHIQCPQK